MSDPTKPTIALLAKLGSIVVHAEEMLSQKGHYFDKLAFEHLLKDGEIQAWLKAMGPFIPVKR